MLDKEDYSLAEYYVKRGLKRSFRHFTWLERDTSWSYEPYDLLCIAAFYSGNKIEAVSYAVKALSFDKENERLISNLNLCLENTDYISLI